MLDHVFVWSKTFSKRHVRVQTDQKLVRTSNSEHCIQYSIFSIQFTRSTPHLKRSILLVPNQATPREDSFHTTIGTCPTTFGPADVSCEICTGRFGSERRLRLEGSDFDEGKKSATGELWELSCLNSVTNC
jgi:hypothetical protein